MTDEHELKDLEEQFADVPFWKYIGCKIEEVGEDTSLLSLEIRHEHLNANMTVHGGVFSTLLDNAMGLASRALAGRFQATTHMNVHFVKATSEGTIYAKGRVVHRTKRTVTTEARVENAEGELLALATGTFRVFT